MPNDPLRDAVRRTTQAAVGAAQRARAAVAAGAQGLRQGLRPAPASAVPPVTPPQPNAPRPSSPGAPRLVTPKERLGSLVGPSGSPGTPGKAGGQTGLHRLLTPSPSLQKAGRVVGKVGKFAGKAAYAAAPVIAGVSALRSYNTPTEDYAKRYGKKPGESFIADLGIRAKGVGEDLVNALNPFSDDTFGTKAKTAAPATPAAGAPSTTTQTTSTPTPREYNARPPLNSGTQTPATQTSPGTTRTLRGPIVQDGPNSFTNVQDASATDIGKPGGGLSVVGSLSPERVASISAANADLQEAREAASIGISQEQYQRQKAQHRRDSEIANLQQSGLSQREATASLLARDAAEVKAAASGGLDAGNLISLMGQQQRGQYQNESLGIRRNQLALNEQQVADQKAATERNTTTKYIDQLNSEDSGVASSARGKLLQAFYQDPDSPEGRLLVAQATQALRQRSGDERGLFDTLASVWDGTPPQYPVDPSLEDFSLEPGFIGETASGTIVTDGRGTVLGNLDDIAPEYAQVLKFIHAQKNQKRGIR